MCSLKDPTHIIVVQNPSQATVPTDIQLIQWAEKALEGRTQHAEITLRIVDPIEGAALNTQYRHKPGPTNVLSFGYPHPSDKDAMIGDIVICAAVVAAEAKAQHKPFDAHFAHMVVHGVLHLLGYDHEQAEDALIMEALESTLVQDFGFAHPYGDRLINE